jgi:FdhE protein
MQGTASGLRTDPAARLAELEQQRPEWRTWIDLLRKTAHELDDENWQVGLAERDIDSVQPDSGAPPLLHGRTIQADRRRMHPFVQSLLETADGGGTLPGFRIAELDSLSLIQAAVCQDPEALRALAWTLCVDDQALTSVAHLAAFPLLQSCGRLLEHKVPRHWPHGYCPICAAWPILAERRGLDRGRYLRCGRCGGEWEVQWLRCIYCGEREHERLGALVPEGTGELLKIETCASCRGYLKSVATLQGMAPFELLLQDLETVEFDLVALERDFGRPGTGGFPLQMRLSAL